MTARLASFFQIRTGEAKMVAFVAALFAFIEIGRGIGGNAADGLFFIRFGVAFLPYLYMILGAVTFVIMLSYTMGLGRLNKATFFSELLLVLAAVLLVERAAILFDQPLLYPLLWISVNIISLILGTFVWNVASEVCDTRQAKRLFSLFTSAGILGGVLGNFVTGPLAKSMGTENLLVLYAALLLVCLALIRAITPQFFRKAQKKSKGLIDEIRVGFDFVRTSRLMQLIAFASVLFSVLFFSISFPFSKIVSASFPNEADVAGFLGLFSGTVTVITFIVSLFIANRLYTRIGVVNSVLILPLTYLAGFVLFAVNYSLTVAVIVRLGQMVILSGVASSAWNAFFNVVPPEKRAQVQSFDSGVTAQVGIALSGGLLILGDRVLNTTQIFVMGMLAAAACGYLVWRMRASYADALLAALRAGFLDVFAATQQGFQYLRMDTNARSVALAGLADPKPTVRRVSAEILGKLNAREAVEPLSRTLADPHVDVRCAVLDALVELNAHQAVDQIAALTTDPEPSVRCSAVNALAALASDHGSIQKTLVSASNDSDPMVRARAAVALHRAGNPERARATLDALLNSNSPVEWIAGLEALAEMKAGVDPSRVEKFLHNDSAPVRTAAAKALGVFKNGKVTSSLIKALDDTDGRVRNVAAVALKSSDGQLGAIVGVLSTGSERAQEAALSSLDGRGAAAQKPIVDWALTQMQRVSEMRAWSAALARLEDSKNSRGDASVAFLRALLQRREAQVAQRILHALALIGTPESIRIISEGLKSKDQEMRAQALEALDTLGDKRIARGLIPLLEGSTAGATEEPHTVLNKLSSNPDPWLRGLAVHSIGELLARDLQTLVARAREDPEPIVREAAASAVVVTGGDMPETLKTLGTIDRILFLRQVPVFADLEPEDLKQIAEIAAERVFPAGEYLCREGDIGDELFVIVEGQVRVAKGSNGELRTLRTLQVGEQVGELAILREQPRSATVIAEGGSVRVLVIRGDAFKAILRDRPEVAMAMLSSLAQRLSML